MTYNRKFAGYAPSCSQFLDGWLTQVAEAIVTAIPKNLRSDGVRVRKSERNYALVEANGVNRSRIAATVEFGCIVDYKTGAKLEVFATYHDESLSSCWLPMKTRQFCCEW
jgi:hypothetical protein